MNQNGTWLLRNTSKEMETDVQINNIRGKKQEGNGQNAQIQKFPLEENTQKLFPNVLGWMKSPTEKPST